MAIEEANAQLLFHGMAKSASYVCGMKKLAFVLLLALSSCIAPHVISPTACQDPKYLKLQGMPIDSMTPRDFEYYKLKDRECEEAHAAANAVEQTQTGQERTYVLFAVFGFLAGILLRMN